MIKGVSEIIENEGREQKDRFLPLILGTLATSLLENMLARKGVIRADEGIIWAGESKDF